MRKVRRKKLADSWQKIEEIMSNYLQEQKRLIEEKKRQVLERSALKKTEGNAQEPSAMSTRPNWPNPAGANLLANDGNFLARFQAMQKEAQANKEADGKDSSSGKLKINLGGVKKKELKPVTSTLPRPTAFENPEPSSSNSEEGKLMLMGTSPQGQGFCFETHVFHDLICEKMFV